MSNVELKKLWTKLLGAIVLILCPAIVLSAQTPATTCDFSKYKYFWMDHYLPYGFLKQAIPEYPAAAKAVRAGGFVQVDIIVDNDGKVRDAGVVKGHPLLGTAALRAARSSTFKPNFGSSAPHKTRRRQYIKTELYFDFKLPD